MGKFIAKRLAFSVVILFFADLAVGNVAGEGFVDPLSLGGYYILMGHQHDGLFSGGTLPEIEKVAVNLRLFKVGMYQGEELCKDFVECQESLSAAILIGGH